MPRPRTTAQAILGMLALRPSWRAYQLTKQLRRNMRFFWPRAESRIYAEARRLVEQGLATAETSSRGGRERTTYAITESGRRQLAQWLSTAPRHTQLECESLLRIFLADFATPEQLQAALDRVRSDAYAIIDVGAEVGPEYIAGTAPFQDQLHVRGILFDFLSSHAVMLLDWAERTERLIGRWPEMSDRERKAAGLALVKENLARFPAERPPRAPGASQPSS